MNYRANCMIPCFPNLNRRENKEHSKWQIKFVEKSTIILFNSTLLLIHNGTSVMPLLISVSKYENRRVVYAALYTRPTRNEFVCKTTEVTHTGRPIGKR